MITLIVVYYKKISKLSSDLIIFQSVENFPLEIAYFIIYYKNCSLYNIILRLFIFSEYGINCLYI
jgi:hypothetical protein